MQSPHPPRPTHPPRSGVTPAESDLSLAARLRGVPEGESGQSVALLLARHWQSAYDYAAICLASRTSSASMVATASFHQMLGQMARGEPGGAVRPYLLVTVRETVRGWTVDDRITAFMPELRKPTGGRGMRAATSMTPEKRQLAARSFRALPAVAQCLLWHTEVEAEHISIPAGLSGLSVDVAADVLDQAREQFRTGIVHAHRELAPTKECSLYNRLLDVAMRRGGGLLRDLQQHLSECRHCRDVADQLSHCENRLGTLLAEAVLGWGVRRYLESRPGRGGAASGGAAKRGGAPVKRGRAAVGQGGRHAGGSGRHRPAPHVSLPGGGRLAAARMHSRTLRTGAVLGAAVLLATVLVITVAPGDGDDGGSVPPTGMAGGHHAGPGADSDEPSAGSSAPTATENPGDAEQGRLRNTAADLCLDVRDGKVKADAGTELAKCSANASQQWSYEKNGLLSSVLRPDLCLDSGAEDGVLALGACVAPSAGRADEVRYDLTVLGELLPRWHEGLAVVPASPRKGTDVLVKVRDGAAEERWAIDSSTAAPETRSIDGKSGPSAKAGPSAKGSSASPRASGDACTGGSSCKHDSPKEQRPGPKGDGKKDRGRQPAPDSTRHGDVKKRYAEVDCCDGPTPAPPMPPNRPGEQLRSPAVRGGGLGTADQADQSGQGHQAD
ncbi:RICIN domain-containing protein [Streptomyces longisporoflavus]|uniref:RICIN domain-containing protein n=1 Tax=Streptomyces longisporoflavus TaxID=28044 RepID=A0ABW7QIR0_9ACTN